MLTLEPSSAPPTSLPKPSSSGCPSSASPEAAEARKKVIAHDLQAARVREAAQGHRSDLGPGVFDQGHYRAVRVEVDLGGIFRDLAVPLQVIAVGCDQVAFGIQEKLAIAV